MFEIAPSVRHLETRPGLFGAALGYLAARRALLPFLASTGYVMALAIRADHGQAGVAWAGGLVAVLGAYIAAGPSLPGNGLAEDGRREVGGLAFALWGLSVVFASVFGAADDLPRDAAGTLFALVSAMAAARSLARVRGTHGMALSLPRAARALLLATVTSLVVAFGLALFVTLRALGDVALGDTLPHDAEVLAGASGLVILAGSAWETFRATRLSLEAGDRALVSLGSVLATGAITAGLVGVGRVPADRATRLAVAIAALLVTVACSAGDAESHVRRARRLVTLVLFGGPVVLLGGLAAEGPGRSFPTLLVTGAIALAIGSAVGYLEDPLRRAEGRLLDAVGRANLALVRADPETSIRDALAALRAFAGPNAESPELWSFAPPRVLTIDTAGYPHERAAEAPDHLRSVAEEEVDATVRTELLEALVVRRPDLRPLARWMDERGALCATLVTREGDVEGVLVLPRGERRVPMSLEEVRAVKRLADAFSGASAALSALQRSLDREHASTKRADDLEEARQRQEWKARAADERARLVTARLAEGAVAGPYAPSARVAFEVMERRLGFASPLVVVAPSGSDVVAYLARVHLAGPRGSSPFVQVDGAKPAEHDIGRWSSASSSPLALAEHGLLVIEDAARLPRAVQQLLADALAQRRPPWESAATLDVVVVLTSTSPDVAHDLASPLAQSLGDALTEVARWPRLHERGEDLRSMVLAALGREGMRVRGAALGIDDAAFELLANHAYDGENAELQAIVKRLARVATGDVVTARDVRSLGVGES